MGELPGEVAPPRGSRRPAGRHGPYPVPAGDSFGLTVLIPPTTTLPLRLEVTKRDRPSPRGRYPSSSWCGMKVCVRTRTPGPSARPSATALPRSRTSSPQPRPRRPGWEIDAEWARSLRRPRRADDADDFEEEGG